MQCCSVLYSQFDSIIWSHRYILLVSCCFCFMILGVLCHVAVAGLPKRVISRVRACEGACSLRVNNPTDHSHPPSEFRQHEPTPSTSSTRNLLGSPPPTAPHLASLKNVIHRKKKTFLQQVQISSVDRDPTCFLISSDFCLS